VSEIRAGVVSTIITAYNRPQLLREAVASVLAQTYRPIEIVIVDDGSTDETGAVGEAFAAAHPEEVRCFRQANLGYARAINAGLRLVSGEFVQFLDSDDLLMPRKFAAQVEALRSHPECGISYCYAREYPIGTQWSGRPTRRTGETFELLFPELLKEKLWPTPSPLYRREVIDASGLYIESPIYAEWEYDCRAAARGVRLHHLPEYLADVRGTHRLEGRQKGGVPPEKLAHYVGILERIHGHGIRAGVRGPALAVFSRRLFEAARLCAAAGEHTLARRLLDLAGWRRVARWSVAAFYRRWRHRAAAAAAAVSGQPIRRWPGVLADRWAQRASRRETAS
jgi:glycosyltransferase involved in cell wall biosynthesis